MKNRYAFDANVIISAFLFKNSKPSQALKRAQTIGFVLLSDEIFTEIEEVILRPKFDRYLSLTKKQELLEDLLKFSLSINPTAAIDECRDPKDNKYLELAVVGQAECIVTGDNDLLVLHPFRGINILTVRDFLAINLNET
ncbi:MAG: putative toxin-antitoxin system toxin component, PIN family [Cyanobacteriota bacterium]|nr:putative toxin-antitoxin system toxin component, PIN family [Cyanobacteriota bacterium]